MVGQSERRYGSRRVCRCDADADVAQNPEITVRQPLSSRTGEGNYKG